MESRALGRGLSALIPEKVEAGPSSGDKISYLTIEKIRDNSQQPRTNYDQAKLDELQSSIKEKGFLQPILVRAVDGEYEVIAGERRLRAARALGLAEIPVIIKDVSQAEAFVIALVENIQRQELNAIEEAFAFRRLIDEFRLTYNQIAQSVGKEPSTINNTVRLLKLPKEIQDGVVSGAVSMGHARALLAVEAPVRQKHLFLKVIEKGLSVRQIEAQIKSEGHTLLRIPRRVSASRSQDLASLEEELQRLLGSKVRIQAKKKRGKIIIEYYSQDDFERILQIIRR